ncbi:hypothetical protein T265_15807, partial [Opisthorchis viverrini]
MTITLSVLEIPVSPDPPTKFKEKLSRPQQLGTFCHSTWRALIGCLNGSGSRSMSHKAQGWAGLNALSGASAVLITP